MATPFPFTSGQVLTAAQMNAITTLPINDQTANYTLVVGDVGKRVIMNVSTASTVTVNNSIFAAGDTIFIANKASNASVITAGAGVSINTSGSLSLAQYGGGTLVALSASTFTFFPAGGIGYGTATGGSSSSITVGGKNYTLLQFTSDANLVVTKAGLFDVLMFGGGGAGGAGFTGDTRFTGGGGGAGGKFEETIYLAAGTAAIDIGVGGAGASNAYSGAAGDTELGGFVVAVAGGRGAYYDDAARQNSNRAEKGGSGGGGTGGGGSATSVVGLKVITQGNDGGTGVTASSTNSGSGGGGGAGAVGSNGTSSVGGAGGAGVEVNTFIAGASLFKAGGGGGGRPAGSGGAGGSSIGGAGTSTADGNGSNAAANTASGGGAGNGSGTSGNGGSGIVYVRFEV